MHRCGSLWFAAPIWLSICAALTFDATVCRSEDRTALVAVTSLNDSGPGSLRDALKSGHRRIAFAVGGNIELKSILEVTVDYVVVDGSGAPSPGITITGKPFSLNGVRDVRLKNLRFRDSDNDNIRIIGSCRNVMIESCSSTHGGDGAIDITHDYKTFKRPSGVIIRNCLIAATDKAMLVVGADNLTLQGNLFTNNGQRNPQLHDAKGFNVVNNLVRNFTIYGFRARAGSTGNVVGNLFPMSPNKPRRPDRVFIIDDSGAACSVYTRGNIGPKQRDPNQLGTSNQLVTKLPAEVGSTEKLLETLITNVGARPLDGIDRGLIKDDPSIRFRPSRSKDK